jgi:hypothetical protein
MSAERSCFAEGHEDYSDDDGLNTLADLVAGQLESNV